MLLLGEYRRCEGLILYHTEALIQERKRRCLHFRTAQVGRHFLRQKSQIPGSLRIQKRPYFYKTNARSFILISQLSKKTLKNGQFQRYKRLSCLQVPFEWRRTFSLKLLLTSFAASNLSIYRHSQGIKRTQNCQIKKDQVIPV